VVAYSISFKLNGTPITLEAGPTSTPSPGGGSVSLEGFPSAFKYGSDTRVLAALSAAPFSTTFEQASGHLWIEIPGLTTATYTLDSVTGGQFWYNNLQYVDSSHTISLTISDYALPGGIIEGTFFGSLTSNGTDSYSVTDGTFYAKIYVEIPET